MVFDDFLRHRRRHELTEGDLAALENAVSETRALPARKTIAEKGEPIHLSTMLIEGIICRYMDDRDGLRQLVAVHVPGDFVDLHGYPLRRLDHDVATITPCKVAFVPHGKLDELIAARPGLAKLLWFSTLLDAAMHREWIFRLGRLDAAARVGHFFCEIEAKLRAVGRSDGTTFQLPLTQADLGEACGMTPVHMNRMLRTLKQRGFLEVKRETVTMPDRKGLARFSEFDPAYLFIED